MIPRLLTASIAGLLVEAAGAQQPAPGQLDYINTSFENASPLWWEEPTPGKVDVYLVYDQERESPNRANGHWHFELQAKPGTTLELTLHNLENVWNGKPGFPSPIARGAMFRRTAGAGAMSKPRWSTETNFNSL